MNIEDAQKAVELDRRIDRYTAMLAVVDDLMTNMVAGGGLVNPVFMFTHGRALDPQVQAFFDIGEQSTATVLRAIREEVKMNKSALEMELDRL